MEETFTKEITFLSKVLQADNTFKFEPVEKIVSFKELSRTDRSQHKLHFMLISIFNGGTVDDTEEEGTAGKFNIDSDKLYDVTAKAVRTLAVVDAANLNEQEKTELLNDSGALFTFGIWFLKNKITPFFSVLTAK